VIGGSFASVDGIPYRSLAQLNEDGSVDTTFNATPSAGVNGTIYAIALYSTNDDINGGKILIGGDFTIVNGVNVSHVARLNADGSLDATFKQRAADFRPQRLGPGSRHSSGRRGVDRRIVHVGQWRAAELLREIGSFRRG